MKRAAFFGLLLALTAPAAWAECPLSASIEVSPHLAQPDEELTIVVWGFVHRFFAPRFVAVRRQGAFLEIELEADPAQPVDGLQSFQLDVPVGRLPAGSYQVDLALQGFPGCGFPPLNFQIHSPAFTLTFQPPAPQPGEAVVVAASGIAPCAALDAPQIDATTISLPIAFDPCEYRDHFELKTLLPGLAEGVYTVRLVAATDGRAFAERRLPVAAATDLRLGPAGRFRVRAAFTTRTSAGQGQAVAVTRDSGQFWFFDPANIELTVKLIDACRPPFGRFWVFAAGMTDVEVELTVEDLATGEIKTYENELGTPFVPILDTAAFADCP